MTRLARLTVLLVATAAFLCWRLGESIPVTAAALLAALGLAMTIDEYKPFDRINRHIQKIRKGQLTWK